MPPNQRLTVRGRSFVPAHGLACYSVGVSDCGCLTSHDAERGLRRGVRWIYTGAIAERGGAVRARRGSSEHGIFGLVYRRC